MDIEDLITADATEEPTRKPRAFTIRKNFQKKNKQNKMFDQVLTKDELETANPIGAEKIYVKTFGCSHNVSDSEFMMGLLVEYGYQLVTDPFEADCIIINSCTVKNPSQEALNRMVFESKEIKKPVVVAGCVTQGEKDIKGFHDVSIVGITQIDRIVEVVEETLKGNSIQLLEKKALPSQDLPKIRKNKFIEILPINTGCLGNCTYCKTKHARGILGSYMPDEILKRMLQACEEGVTEIWLTSEDTGAYGQDIGTNISQLLKLLVSNIPENIMLRIGMTNPPYILSHLESIAKAQNHPRVFGFLHIPVQSGSNIVLERMNREYTREEFEKVCDYLLEHVPDMIIATDIICGFPGESEEDHLDTMNLIEKYKFDVMNISQFYPRPGTVAQKMKQCNSKDKKDRSRDVTNYFHNYRYTKKTVGSIERVYINETEDTKQHGIKCIGHTKNYTKVIQDFDPSLVGKQVLFKITSVQKWHIEGEIVEKNIQVEDVNPQYFVDANEALKIKKLSKEGNWRFKQDSEREEVKFVTNKLNEFAEIETKSSDEEKPDKNERNSIDLKQKYATKLLIEPSYLLLASAFICLGLGITLSYFGF